MYALVIIDSVFVVAVCRMTSMVIIYDRDDMAEISLVNSTLEQFCQFDTIWRKKMFNISVDADDETRKIVSQHIISEMKKIDAQAFENEDSQVWPVNIEEFCNGVV